MKLDKLNIRIDELSDQRVIRFLQDHLQLMREITPPGCVHALDIDALKRPEVTFWTVWDEQTLICCGALKELDPQHAELKSMRTAPAHLEQGVASVLLNHIISEAKKRNYKRLSLETGSYEAFVPARKLYEKFGFDYCGPFSDYATSSNHVFMTIQL